MHALARFSALLIAASLPVLAEGSCGAAFCLVNTNWGAQGVWTEPGWRADLRFEYIDQDQPRTGTRDINVGEIPGHHDDIMAEPHVKVLAEKLRWRLELGK